MDFNTLFAAAGEVTEVFTAQDVLVTILMSFILTLIIGKVYQITHRGVAYSQKDDYDRAIADFSEVIRLHPEYSVAFVHRAIAYARKRDNDRAIADFNEAIRLDPTNALAFCYRGELKRQINEATSGNADIEKARQLGKIC